MAGGTNDGRRPDRYTYWRVGDGGLAGHAVPFSIERAGEYHTKPAYLTGSIDHPDATQVYYHLDGEAIFEQPNRVTRVLPGNLLVIPPGHIGYYRAAAGMKYHWLSLGRHWPREWGERPSVRLLALRYDVELEGRFTEIRELLILQKAGYPLRVVGAFYGLMARIEELSPSLSVSQSPYPESVRNAITYLREHVAEPFDAETTAAAANLSQSHLRALFERWVGESPRRFHTRSRIERAARLLREQELSVSAAALQVGFSDVRHFSRVFKGVTGVRPREWAALSASDL
jgi:AraC-like DNA-binding protein